MRHLVNVVKKVELELRANGKLSYDLLNELAALKDWDYRIVKDAMLRINMAMQANDMNFVFKQYERGVERLYPSNKKVDLLIACLKRSQKDTSLTDAWNRLVVPTNLQYEIIEVWGNLVTKSRNIAVDKACELGARYLLFIDDDILAPNSGLMKLFDVMNETKAPAVGGHYYRKVEPLISAHTGEDKVFDPDSGEVQGVNLLAMGFTLIDLDKVSTRVPFPLFWEFGAPDGYWSLGEDAFFTKNVSLYTGEKCLVDTSVKCLHYDKTWKKMYGKKDEDVTYASNVINDFEHVRIPPKFPFMVIGIPTRQQNDPVATNLETLPILRGYKTDTLRVYGMNVDAARNQIAKQALEVGADYLLFIDDDVVPPVDGLTKLMEHIEKPEVDIVSGTYMLKGQPLHSCFTQLDDRGVVTEISRIQNLPEFYKCNWLIGLGFTLIDMKVFKQARMPWFQCHAKGKDNDVNEDAHFCELMFENAYNIYVDQSIKCLHVDYKEAKVYGWKPIITKDYSGFEWLDKLEKVEFNPENK